MTPDRIRAIRAWLGETQEQFGKRLGVSRTGVARWELGLRNPRGPAYVLLSQLWDQMQMDGVEGGKVRRVTNAGDEE